MEDITFLSDDEKVEKLVADVKHKFHTFSISNTLFPKNEISDSDLKFFFEKIADRTTKILNAPSGTITKLVNNQLEQTTYTVISNMNITLEGLADATLKYLQESEVIAFYDLTYDPNMARYSIRIYKFEDELRLKSIKREKKIDDLLDRPTF
jgi:antitoxin component of RelBE/YafQ-DinJ toxin-antitoxin module